MRDTAPEVEARYQAMLLARSGEERLKMAGSMYATARAFAIAALPQADWATPARLRQALFLRFYGQDFDERARARIFAQLGVEEGREARRRVPIDWGDLEMALTWHSDEWMSYLDLRTGEICQGRAFAFEGEVGDGELSEDEIEAGLAEGHLIHVEPFASSVEYGWMEEFAASVRSARLRDHLDEALRGRRPFRRFKDALARSPSERERWFRFHDERMKEAVREWLAEHDLEPTTVPARRPPRQPNEEGV